MSKHLSIRITKKLVEYAQCLLRSPLAERLAKWVENATIYIIGNQASDSDDISMQTGRSLRIGLVSIGGITAIILLWGILVPIESAAIAHGKVIVSSYRKTIQHLEGGILAELPVKEGERVKKGQALLQLDDTQLRAEIAALESQYWTAKTTEARLKAETEKSSSIVFDADLTAQAEHNTALANALKTETTLFTTSRKALQTKREMLESNLAQISQQIDGTETQIQSEQKQRALLASEVASQKTLMEKGLTTKSRLFTLQRAEEEINGKIAEYRTNIAQLNQRAIEKQTQLNDLDAEQSKKTAEDSVENRNMLVKVQEALKAKRDILDRTTLRAPAEGIVTGIKYHTIGAVIAAGSPLMDVIPETDSMTVLAQLSPLDIDAVHIGQDARIVLSSYKSRSTAWVKGKVLTISADIITEDTRQGPIGYYDMQIEVDKADLSKLDNISLYPGMPAEVYVNTGSRSFFMYLMQPIFDSMHHAFRDQ